MQNLPNITPNEIAVVAVAVLVLFVAPGLIGWSDARRRRRADRAAALETAAHASATDFRPVSVEAPPAAEALPDAAARTEAEAALPNETLVRVEPPARAAAETAVAAQPDADVRAHTAPAPSWASPAESGSRAELEPLSGAAKHRFRLDDLHRVELSDWPPPAVRNDPERSRSWREAEQVAQQYQTAIHLAAIASPYPARSHCLGAAAADHAQLRLSFLLFPVLWPVSQNQAVAQAIFRIDRVSGEVRGWVDALRPQELSEENRREIHEAGGDF
jgi:hypothetical protein